MRDDRVLPGGALAVLLIAAVVTLLAAPWLWSLDGVAGLQAVGAWLKLPMLGITFLGNEEWFLILVPLIYWCINKPLGVDLGILLMAVSFTNCALKAFFKHPRPYWLDASRGLTDADSFSTPSGHAESSTVLYGFIAYFLARGSDQWSVDSTQQSRRVRLPLRVRLRPLWIALLVAFIALVSLSRVYLGVHFPGDILWGIAVGLLLLAVYPPLKSRLEPRLARLSMRGHAVAAVLVAAAALGIQLLALAIPFGDGPRYPDLNAAALRATLNEASNLSGMIFGLWIGLVLERKYVSFRVDGPAGQRVLRYVLGVVGLFAIWMGLRILFPQDPVVLGLALRVVRYALSILWAIVAWPWLFVRLGLGTSALPPTRILRRAITPG